MIKKMMIDTNSKRTYKYHHKNFLTVVKKIFSTMQLQ